MEMTEASIDSAPGDSTESIPRDETAYHEAGHAVASVALGRPLAHVTIIREGRDLGHTSYRAWREGFDPRVPGVKITGVDRLRMEAAIVVALAGPAAHRKYAGRDLSYADAGEGSDLDTVVELAGYLTGSPTEKRAYIDWLKVRARDIFVHPGHWEAVRLVLQRRLLWTKHSIAQNSA